MQITIHVVLVFVQTGFSHVHHTVAGFCECPPASTFQIDFPFHCQLFILYKILDSKITWYELLCIATQSSEY